MPSPEGLELSVNRSNMVRGTDVVATATPEKQTVPTLNPKKTSVHEGAHAATATLDGVKVNYVSIEPKAGSDGRTHLDGNSHAAALASSVIGSKGTWHDEWQVKMSGANTDKERRKAKMLVEQARTGIYFISQRLDREKGITGKEVEEEMERAKTVDTYGGDTATVTFFDGRRSWDVKGAKINNDGNAVVSSGDVYVASEKQKREPEINNPAHEFKLAA